MARGQWGGLNEAQNLGERWTYWGIICFCLVQKTAALSALVEVFDSNLCYTNLVHTALAGQPPGHTGSHTLACGYPPSVLVWMR